MPVSRRILVLGGSSFVGRHLAARLGPARALWTYCRRPQPGGVYFDDVSMRLLDIIGEPEAFSHAVILLGETKPDSCAQDPRRSQAVNVDGIIRLLQELRRWAITPVFASSEFVFDGTRGGYTEDDPPRPILTYGRQKLQVEQHLQEGGGAWAVVRLAKVVGAERGDGTLFSSWLEAIERGQTIRCAFDQIFSPIYVGDVVEAILRLIERDARGLFHAAGPRPFSRLQLLELLLERLRAHGRAADVRVVPCSIHDFGLRERRPLDVSMRPDKLVAATGLQLQDMAVLCDRLIAQPREAVAA